MTDIEGNSFERGNIMSSVKSAPGYMNIYELFYLVGKGLYNPVISKIDRNEFGGDLTDDYHVYSMFDVLHPHSLEPFVVKEKYPLTLKVLHLKIAIRNDERYQLLRMDNIQKQYLDEYSFVSETYGFMVMHQCRSMLSGNQFKSYVLSDYAYHELPPEFWSYDIHWYRLLIDGAACGDLRSIGKFYGSIYFKVEEVKNSVNAPPSESSPASYSSSLINLNTYTTPWLEVLNAVYNTHGKDELAEVSKISIESFISDYIKKCDLDIASTDIPYLAKFIRLAEQKEGKKYHAKRKKQQAA